MANTLLFIGTCLPLLIGASLAWRDFGHVWVERDAERIALFGWVIASAVGVAAGARFYDHYYIQLIPPLVLLAAPHYARFWAGTMQAPFWWLRPGVTYVWLGLIAIAFSLEHWRELASQRDISETGRYISEHSAPNERIFVWGQAPKIYLDARRRPASRYIATFPLTGYIFGGLTSIDTRKRIMPGAWELLEEDFRKHPPIFIVDVQAGAGNAQYPVHSFPILANLLTDRYRLVARTTQGLVYRLR